MFRVLIADDEETIRNGLKNLIESYDIGLSVIATAEDGEMAISLIEEYKPEIILMDINMPFMNGLEVIEQIRKTNENTKIIIISGYNQFDYAQKALELGVFSYLLKPINYRNFKDILVAAMDSYSKRMWEISQIKQDGDKFKGKDDIGNNAIEYIKANFPSSDISLNGLAEHLFISQSYLAKTIKEKTGVNFTDYLNKLRIDMAISLLLDEDIEYTIKDIADMVGYNSQHYFSRAFKNYMGISPNQYRNKKSSIYTTFSLLHRFQV